MGTVAEKLAYLIVTKEKIKNAIESHGVAVPAGTPFRDYAPLISNITDNGHPKAPAINISGMVGHITSVSVTAETAFPTLVTVTKEE